MSSKKRRRKNTETSDKALDKEGILVVPPDLLQKLGINLEKFHHVQENCDTSPDNDEKLLNCAQQLPKSCLTKEITMLETASLMKKALFLSPTFTKAEFNATDIVSDIYDTENLKEKVVVTDLNISLQVIENNDNSENFNTAKYGGGMSHGIDTVSMIDVPELSTIQHFAQNDQDGVSNATTISSEGSNNTETTIKISQSFNVNTSENSIIAQSEQLTNEVVSISNLQSIKINEEINKSTEVYSCDSNDCSIVINNQPTAKEICVNHEYINTNGDVVEKNLSEDSQNSQTSNGIGTNSETLLNDSSTYSVTKNVTTNDLLAINNSDMEVILECADEDMEINSDDTHHFTELNTSDIQKIDTGIDNIIMFDVNEICPTSKSLCDTDASAGNIKLYVDNQVFSTQVCDGNLGLDASYNTNLHEDNRVITLHGTNVNTDTANATRVIENMAIDDIQYTHVNDTVGTNCDNNNSKCYLNEEISNVNFIDNPNQPHLAVQFETLHTSINEDDAEDSGIKSKNKSTESLLQSQIMCDKNKGETFVLNSTSKLFVSNSNKSFENSLKQPKAIEGLPFEKTANQNNLNCSGIGNDKVVDAMSTEQEVNTDCTAIEIIHSVNNTKLCHNNVNNNHSSNVNRDVMDKINTIADTLSKFSYIIDNRNKVESNVVTGQKDKCKLQSKHNVQSKLSVHGVEKPGGVTTKKLEVKMCGKSYSRVKKNKNVMFVQNIANEINIDNIELDISTSIPDNRLHNEQCFCNCFDFGNINFSARHDFKYQHLHFVNIPINCQLHDIFIDRYNVFFEQVNSEDNSKEISKFEDVNTNKVNNDNDVSKEIIEFDHDNTNITYSNYICWNSIYNTTNNTGEKQLSVVCEFDNDCTYAKVNNKMRINDNDVSNIYPGDIIQPMITEKKNLNETNYEVETNNRFKNIDPECVLKNFDASDETNINKINTEVSHTNILNNEFPKKSTEFTALDLLPPTDTNMENELTNSIKKSKKKKNLGASNSRTFSLANPDFTDGDKLMNTSITNKIDTLIPIADDKESSNISESDTVIVIDVLSPTVSNIEEDINVLNKTNNSEMLDYKKPVSEETPPTTALCSPDIEYTHSSNDLNMVVDEENEDTPITVIITAELSETSPKTNDVNVDISDGSTIGHNSKAISLGSPNSMKCDKNISSVQLNTQGSKRNRASSDSRSSSDLSLAKYKKRKLSETPEPKNMNKKSAKELNSSGNVTENNNLEEIISNRDITKCGVCYELIPSNEWINHIRLQHNYIAWKEGDPTINADDSDEVRQHLNMISKIHGLMCTKCDKLYKFVKVYLKHVKNCSLNKLPDDTDVNTSLDASQTNDLSISGYDGENISTVDVVCCGVCNITIDTSQWYKHIQKSHQYLAWKSSEPPLDLNDEKQVAYHLETIIKCVGALICDNCGISCKIARHYVRHIKKCQSHSITSVNDVSNTDTHEIGVTNENNMEMEISVECSAVITCGVCKQEVDDVNWIAHIQKEHNYVAWKVGEIALDVENQASVISHLKIMSKQLGALTCYMCGKHNLYAKSFLNHVKSCNIDKNEGSYDTSSTKSSTTIISKCKQPGSAVICGVCNEHTTSDIWYEHIQEKHNYLAWKSGDPPLDLNDKEEVDRHLYKLIKKLGGLTCSKCGLVRKYVKVFRQHVAACGSDVQPRARKLLNITVDDDSTVQCGVCNVEMHGSTWIMHIQGEHNYLAWKVGEEPLDLNDEAKKVLHLKSLIDLYGSLICRGCGYIRKKEQKFLRHIENCNLEITSSSIASSGTCNNIKSTDNVICGVCSKSMVYSDWKNHAIKAHYNLAWIEGNAPMDIRNVSEALRYLKSYVDKGNKLKCHKCGVIRRSTFGFYAHILICEKSEEEVEELKEECKICGTSYLFIYRVQHSSIHIEKDRPSNTVETRQKDEAEESFGAPRKAAQRARAVINDYKTSIINGNNLQCPDCEFTTDSKKKMDKHKCSKDDYSSDSSKEYKQESSESSDNSDVDSNISDEEKREHPKKKSHSSNNTAKALLPFPVNYANKYIAESYNDYTKKNFSEDELYSHWRDCQYEIVDTDQIKPYLPQIKESCQLMINNKQWTKIERFKSVYNDKVFSVFLGGSVQSLAWAPSDGTDEFLAVSCNNNMDDPVFYYDKQYDGPNLLQIWNFGQLNHLGAPRLALGVAHAWGALWAQAWCPSGARGVRRLGLLALASSTGRVLVLAVPHPHTLSGEVFCKLKPVAELRFCDDANWTPFQATSLSWSTEKGHSVIVVGYSNGYVAMFDLNIDSPMLRSEEDGVTILYPYYDEQCFNSCIQAVSTQGAALGVGALRGAGVWARGGPAALRGARELGSVAGAAFLPHWPALLLAHHDPAYVSKSTRVAELEPRGGGRRAGAGGRWAGCERCGRVAAAAPPLLFVLRAHPAHARVHRLPVATITMEPLNNTKKKVLEDDLVIKMEPCTYDKIIDKYGLKIKLLNPNDSAPTLADTIVNRFPLSDMADMAYCLSKDAHSQLAVGTRAGVLVVLSVN